MTDARESGARDGLGAQIWGALKNALTEEDPVAVARRERVRRAATNEAASTADAASPKRTAADEPAGAAAPAAARPARGADAAAAPLPPMAAALLEQVLSRPSAYTALTDRLLPLEPVIADERMRYQAAFALIRGARSIEQVTQAIDLQHLQAVDAEVARFTAQCQDRRRAEIGGREDEAREVSARIEASAAQVAQLNEELRARIAQIEAAVANDRERLATLAGEIAAKQREFDGVQRQFDEAVAAVRARLAAAKARVLGYLA